MRRILFVCVENSGRREMAEAFERAHGGARVEAHSAGSCPSGTINPRAVQMMAERGIDLVRSAFEVAAGYRRRTRSTSW